MASENSDIQPVNQTSGRSNFNSDFWIYWSGQTISNIGGSVTIFALPLLVYNLTGSAIDLGLATAANFVPYLLFGLLIGAWSDRVNRKQLMIFTDVGRAAILMMIPLFAGLGWLNVWWIYLVSFLHSTLTIAFDACQFAAIPSLVDKRNLVNANGRIQASYAAAQVIGPLLAGILVTTIPATWLFSLDALTYILAAISLLFIRRSFNTADQPRKHTHIGQDVIEGLRYVLKHPVLRNISIMMALINFVMNASFAQLVLFAKERLYADDFQVSLFYTAGSLGVVLLSLLAGPLRKRWSFSKVALSTLIIDGFFILIMAFTPWYWLAIVFWALAQGTGLLFNVNTASLRQSIVPPEMLGRIMSIAGVLAWSAIPLGSTLGGFVISWTGNIALMFALSGGLCIVIAVAFSFTALGNAERYLPSSPSDDAGKTNEPGEAEIGYHA